MSTRILRKSLGLAVFLIPLLLCGPGFAQEAEVTNPILNVRSGPGTDHEVVAQIKKGERFPVIKVEKSWVQIEIDGETLEERRKEKYGEDAAPYEGETWVYRSLIQFIGKPPDFEERQIDFQNWALDAIPVTYIEFKSDWQIWVRLPPDKYSSRQRVRRIARQMAEEYQKQTGYMEREVVIKVLRGKQIYTSVSM